MKKFSVMLVITILMTFFALVPEVGAEEKIEIPENANGVTLPIEQGELSTTNAVLSLVAVASVAQLGSADAPVEPAMLVTGGEAGDQITWNVVFAAAGTYKVEMPVCSPEGVGALSLYLEDTKVYSAGNFKASNTHEKNIFNNTAVFYVKVEKAGETHLSVRYDAAGMHLLAPSITSYAGEIPQEAPYNKYINVVNIDEYTSLPNGALVMDEDTYYAFHFNISVPFKGIVIPEWTPDRDAMFKVSVYYWDEDIDESLCNEAIIERDFTLSSDGIIVYDFEKALPEGEYLIYITCLSGGSNDSGLYMKSGVGTYEDMGLYGEETDLYFEAYTDITRHVIVPDKMVHLSLIVEEYTDKMFLKLGEKIGEEPTATSKPTESPSQAPATTTTESPSQVPETITPTIKVSAEATLAPDTSSTSSDKTVIGIIIGIAAAIIVIVIIVAVYVKRKRNSN